MNFSKDDTLAIKGVALLFLLHHHNFSQASRFEDYDVSFFPFSSNLVINAASFFKICVGMFAFLSAYGLTLSLKKYSPDTCLDGKQYSNYFKNRFIKLMWGFWFAYIISFIVCAIIKPSHLSVYFPNNDSNSGLHGFFYILIDFMGLASLMGTPTLNGTWWYMSLAIFIVMAVPFAARLTKRNGIFFTSLLFLFIPRLVQIGTPLTIGQTSNIFRWIFSIVLGVFFAQNDLLVKMKSFMITKNKILSKILKFSTATLILFMLYEAFLKLGGPDSNYSYEFKDNIIPLFVIYYLYDFIIDIPIIRNILMIIGKHSMNIFFTHTFIRLYLFNEFTYSFGNWFLIDFVLLLVSFAVSLIMELIKKYSGYNNIMNKVLKLMNKNTAENKNLEK